LTARFMLLPLHLKAICYGNSTQLTCCISHSNYMCFLRDSYLSIFYFPMKLLHNTVLKGFYCHLYLVQLLIATCNQYGLIFNILSPDICFLYCRNLPYFSHLPSYLTARSRFLLVKLTSSQLFKKFPTF